MKRKWRINWRRVIVMALTAAALAVAVGVVLNNYVFVVRRINVTGVDDEYVQHVIDASNIRLGDSIFRVARTDAEVSLREDGSIKLKQLNKKLPDTVELTVVKCTPVAVVRHLGYTYLLDRELFVMNCAGNSDADGMIEITGVAIGQTPVGTQLNIQEGEGAALKQILSGLYEDGLLGETARIELGDQLNISVFTRSGFEYKLGDATQIMSKLAWVRDLTPRLSADGKQGGVIDVSTVRFADFAEAATPEPQSTPLPVFDAEVTALPVFAVQA